MALESSEVRSFGFGHVYIADVGSTEPANISAEVDPDAGWIELGHISDAGPRFSFGKGRSAVPSWQSFPDPVRNLKAAAATTCSFDLLQWNRYTLPLALGGGTWAESGGMYTFTPADAADVNEKALIVEATDDVYNYRFIFRRTENQANVDFAWTGSALAPLPIQSTILTPDGTGTAPYIIQSDDPNIGAAEAAS